jgi:hypothetical protein
MTQNQYDSNYAGPFFTEQQLAQRWGKHPRTLARYRTHGTGPIFYKVAQLPHTPRLPVIRYKLHDVLAYELANSIFPDLHNHD